MTSIAIAHDYLTQRRGAERVVATFANMFPDAPIYTSLYNPEKTFDTFRDRDIHALPLNRLPVLRKHHRWAFPLLAPAFSRCSIDADLTLISSSGWAHGAKTTGKKIVFCHSPARWLYQSGRHLGARAPLAAKVALALGGKPLRRWDHRAAHSADRYVAVSNSKAREIRDLYRIEATVVHSPMSLDVDGIQESVSSLDDGFLLCVAAALPYKNVDAIVESFSSLPNERLVVVGGIRPGQPVPVNVTVLHDIAEAELRWLYAHCSGLVSASYEDFGLTPIEAAAFGKPTAALQFGGHLDTIIPGETGVFFSTPTPEAIVAGIRSLRSQSWSHDVLTQHAEQFSVTNFTAKIQAVIDEVL